MRYILSSLFTVLIFNGAQAQEYSNQYIKDAIAQYKTLERGPYKEINWFCEDGSVREARDPCPDSLGDGVQHASYKKQVKDIAQRNHIYLGEILASTDKWKFWDGLNNHSRLKQYQLQRYLESVDDGWIQRKSQFYRGAKQIEDEEEWGRAFYYTVLSSNEILERDYFLIRESLRDLPHDGDTNLSQEIRSLSKILAERHPKFMELRIKIHGNPQAQDIKSVRNFLEDYEADYPEKSIKDFNQLIDDMQVFFKPVAVSELPKLVEGWNDDSFIKTQTVWFSRTYAQEKDPAILLPVAANLMCAIRYNIEEDARGTRRTSALELSLRLEELIFQQAAGWQPNTLQDHTDKIFTLSQALAAAGYVELWEWKAVEDAMFNLTGRTIAAQDLNDFIKKGRSQVEWGTGMVNAIYGDEVEKYTGFEPFSYGFIDDRIRSSLLLPLGDAVGDLGDILSRQLGYSSQVAGVNNVSTVRGLNPGYATGVLKVISGNAAGLDIDASKIYVFDHPPSDLKPVAGIATVSEGNLVSHVQLLARNLGIPNAALSIDNLSELKSLDGEQVFYAVSHQGTVILKASKDMTDEEKNLFNNIKVADKKTIKIPEGKLKLDQRTPLDMAAVNSQDSGVLCGPKAANLGQLKQLFPEQVVNGVVIPFGVFKEHMQQAMPDTNGSYWDFLKSAFAKAESQRAAGSEENEIIKEQLTQFKILRDAIMKMPFTTAFENQFAADFKRILGAPLGQVPVFLRSDTNMEDLEEFTGAGLNLTVFNAVEKQRILNGIREVWASPYTERSFKWRQAYLENPENVYPSILVIPTVDVDYSGVLITKDFLNNKPDHITVAMSRGAGGAVDGQAAETYIIDKNGTGDLISPARENKRRRLPVTGGSIMEHVDFDNSILTAAQLKEIKKFATQVHKIMPGSKDGTYDGAWDIELGFKDDKLYLFQIRPFVENDQARNSAYLTNIDKNVVTDIDLLMNKEIAL